MKLVIQIPCWNEERQLGDTVAALPRVVPGFDVVEILIVDDGSSDGTVEAARCAGVDHVVCLRHHQGLAAAFRAGIAAALHIGADVIVNTDADNQYCADDIPRLVELVAQGRADIVVGARPIEKIEDFSWTRNRLQRLGSWVVRIASGTSVEDATSGFRAWLGGFLVVFVPAGAGIREGVLLLALQGAVPPGIIVTAAVAYRAATIAAELSLSLACTLGVWALEVLARRGRS